MATTSPLPAFLTQDRADIHAKFVDLEWQQRERLLAGSQARGEAPAHSSAATESSAHTPPSSSPWARLSGDAIAARNRYLNVEPFAQNRIKLRVRGGRRRRDAAQGEEGTEASVAGDGENVWSDYINASPITLGGRRYIATQGPKDSNINHFYRMLAAETGSPAVVVMLTQTHEAGREKCFQYYPLSAEESPLTVPKDEELGDGYEGQVELVSVREDLASRSQVRHLKLRMRTGGGSAGGGGIEVEGGTGTGIAGQDDGQQQQEEGKVSEEEEKDIYHILFAGWPDFLVPEGDDRAALLELIRLSALSLSVTDASGGDSNTATTATNGGHAAATSPAPQSAANLDPDPSNPRIVHCSAGVGRSGTFIALDYLLGLLYAGQLDDVPPDKDPIADTVDLMRQQRMMMVQGEGQFHFLYDVLREQFEARRKGL